MTSRPSGVRVLIASDRLLLLSMVKYRASTSGMSRSWVRVTSPPSTRSTLRTSAPYQASIWVHAGPAWTPVKSITLVPVRGSSVMISVSFEVAVRRVTWPARR